MGAERVDLAQVEILEMRRRLTNIERAIHASEVRQVAELRRTVDALAEALRASAGATRKEA